MPTDNYYDGRRENEAALKVARETLRHTWPCGCGECQRVTDLFLHQRKLERIKALGEWTTELSQDETILAQREDAVTQTWRCFHCEFQTTDRAEAAAHFGDREESEPLCLTWTRLNSDERAQEYQSLTRELEGEREETARLRSRIEGLEDNVSGTACGIASRFKGCTTIQEVWCLYDSLEGRALVAEQATPAIQREAKIEALKWARAQMRDFTTSGSEFGTYVINTEIARLEAEAREETV